MTGVRGAARKVKNTRHRNFHMTTIRNVKYRSNILFLIIKQKGLHFFLGNPGAKRPWNETTVRIEYF